MLLYCWASDSVRHGQRALCRKCDAIETGHHGIGVGDTPVHPGWPGTTQKHLTAGDPPACLEKNPADIPGLGRAECPRLGVERHYHDQHQRMDAVAAHDIERVAFVWQRHWPRLSKTLGWFPNAQTLPGSTAIISRSLLGFRCAMLPLHSEAGLSEIQDSRHEHTILQFATTKHVVPRFQRVFLKRKGQEPLLFKAFSNFYNTLSDRLGSNGSAFFVHFNRKSSLC